MMLETLGRQLQLTFTLFLLKILWNRCDLEKFLSIILRNILATFVFTFKLYGGLNHMIFRGS